MKHADISLQVLVIVLMLLHRVMLQDVVVQETLKDDLQDKKKLVIRVKRLWCHYP